MLPTQPSALIILNGRLAYDISHPNRGTLLGVRGQDDAKSESFVALAFRIDSLS